LIGIESAVEQAEKGRKVTLMISRRTFLKTSTLLMASFLFDDVFASGRAKYNKTERVLDLYNIHTREKLIITYYSSGTYDYDAIEQINYLLRCHYTNEVRPLDIRVIDLLCDIKDVVGKDKEAHIISGYRSPAYNNYLRSIGRDVARNSLHLDGLAVDFSIPGISSSKLSDVAKSFQAGGVGKYTEFVHIDVGQVRHW